MTLFFNKKKVAHSTYIVTQKIYIILYVQNMPFIEERWKFCTSHKQNVLKNFAQSINTIVSQKKKKKKKHNFAQRNYIIMCVWSTQFFKECLIFHTFNIHNFAQSTNTIIQRNYIIMCVWSTQYFGECSIFRTFNIHNFSKIKLHVQQTLWLKQII